jgi:hypothetical protein
MLLRFQKAAVRGNYETGNQAFSKRLRFLTIRVAGAALLLLFTGIHNAWDAVTYHIFVKRSRGKEDEGVAE